MHFVFSVWRDFIGCIIISLLVALNIQTRLSDQIKALELKLKKFEVVDKITDQIKN